jgi:pyruvate dehydrogenase E2 component (dihydrolipoamide acetyltransferase)
MATEFTLPELGEGVDSAEVAQIYIAEGDEIEANQNIMELETEKAVADLPCPHAGKVSTIHVSEGDTIEVGQTLLTIEEVTEDNQQVDQSSEEQGQKEASEAETPSGGSEVETDADDAQEAKEVQKPETEQQEETKAEASAPVERERQDEVEDVEETVKKQESRDGLTASDRRDDGKQRPPAAGPATRRLARKLGIELDQFQPPEGSRIQQEDIVRAYVESGKAAMLTTKSLPDFTTFGPVERESLNKITQTAARRLTGSWRSVPHVTQHGLADITELEAARRQHAERAQDARPKITLTSIAMKSVVGLLKEYPKFNSSFDYEQSELILKKHYHIGVAVDTDHGLLVPVIRDVDRKSIEQIAEELTGLADKARRRQLGKDDFEGGTFTISNQGGIGGGEFTPIVNYPEVAILGMARARPELRMVDGQPAERLMLPLSLSYDHRVINGADAARFIDRLESILSDEFSLLIAT